jgi:hypothetical protein
VSPVLALLEAIEEQDLYHGRYGTTPAGSATAAAILVGLFSRGYVLTAHPDTADCSCNFCRTGERDGLGHDDGPALANPAASERTPGEYHDKADMLAELEARGIKAPRLYGLGFTHNNCGGGCVKSGRSHFVQLLAAFPARYDEWERNEEDVRQHIGKDVSILRPRDGEAGTLTLRELRVEVEAGATQPMFDIGGCACFEEPS